MNAIDAAAISPLVFWAIAIGFWIFGRLRDKVRESDVGAVRSKGSTRPSGPVGRTASLALPSHEEIEDRTSLEVEREVVDYDTRITERTVPPIVDLDNESAFAAQRRILQAERRSKAHVAADHDAFHNRISAPDAHASEVEAVRARRRAALRAAWITSEVLAPPVSSRRTS